MKIFIKMRVYFEVNILMKKNDQNISRFVDFYDKNDITSEAMM